MIHPGWVNSWKERYKTILGSWSKDKSTCTTVIDSNQCHSLSPIVGYDNHVDLNKVFPIYQDGSEHQSVTFSTDTTFRCGRPACFHSSPTSVSITRWCRQCLFMRNTCPNHLNRWRFRTTPLALVPLPTTLCLASLLLTIYTSHFSKISVIKYQHECQLLLVAMFRIRTVR